MKRIAALLLFASTLSAAEPDLEMQTRIREEGFKNSKVMEIAAALTDTIGARVTGSPNLKRANEWTRDKLTEFGLSNAHLEAWEFGRGWVTDSYVIRMVAPDAVQLYGIPRAWSPGTNGLVRAKVVRTKLETKEDLEKNRGKYAGMILLNSEPRELKPQSE
ncbi:MAG TPA: peptidase, partial [Thermoanaerobaculia bacterium]